MKLNIKNLINSTRGKYVISILLGLGLATLFRKACSKQNCLVFKAPPIDKINNKIFKVDNRCYTYTTNHGSCNNNKKQIEFE